MGGRDAGRLRASGSSRRRRRDKNRHVSYLTQLIICTPDGRDEAILSAFSFQLSGDRFGRPDDNTGRVGTVRALQEGFGGYKSATGCVWGGVLNYADQDAVIRYLAAQAWAEPESVQVLVKTEDERAFRMYLIRDGGPVLCQPAGG